MEKIFKTTGKNCFKVHTKLNIGWNRGRSKDFKMTPLRGHTDYVNCFDFYRQHVVSGSNDTKVILWKVNSTKTIHTLSDHTGLITTVKFNEMYIASGSVDHTAKVWDCTTGVPIASIQHNGTVFSLGFDENSIYTACDDHLGRICDLRTGNVVSTLNGHTQSLKSIFVGNVGQMITSAMREIKVWDTRNDNVLRAFNTQSNIKCITFAGNDRIVAGLDNGFLQIFNINNGSVEYSSGVHNGSINCIHTDGKTIVTGSNDHTIKVMDLDTKVITYHLAGHEGPVNSVQLDDNKIVSGGGDMCLKVYNRRGGSELYTLLGGSLQQRSINHPEKQGCTQMMFDSCRIVASYNTLLRVYSFLITD